MPMPVAEMDSVPADQMETSQFNTADFRVVEPGSENFAPAVEVVSYLLLLLLF